jgi:hypothetical protein
MAAPTITSAASASFQVGVAGTTFTVTTTGFVAGQPGITAAGPALVTPFPPFLPPGVTFTDNTGGTATIAGTPSGGAGSYAFTITANNGTAPNATQAFTLACLPDNLPIDYALTCPRCKFPWFFPNQDGGVTFRCGGCEWPMTVSTVAPTGVTNAGITAGVTTAIPVASGGASFTNGMLVLIGTGITAEVVKVVGSSTGTSIPVPSGFQKGHLTGAAIGQLSVNPTLTGVGEDQVPAAPGWGF